MREQTEQGKNDGKYRVGNKRRELAKQERNGGNRAEQATNVGNRQSSEQIEGKERSGIKLR